jgi:hypothetical protein
MAGACEGTAADVAAAAGAAGLLVVAVTSDGFAAFVCSL